jgi:hypothetical protein
MKVAGAQTSPAGGREYFVCSSGNVTDEVIAEYIREGRSIRAALLSPARAMWAGPVHDVGSVRRTPPRTRSDSRRKRASPRAAP